VSSRDVFLAEPNCAEVTLEGEIDIANCAQIPLNVEGLCRAGFRRIRMDTGVAAAVRVGRAAASVLCRATPASS